MAITHAHFATRGHLDEQRLPRFDPVRDRHDQPHPAGLVVAVVAHGCRQLPAVGLDRSAGGNRAAAECCHSLEAGTWALFPPIFGMV